MSTGAKRLTVLILLTSVSFSAFFAVLVYQNKTSERARAERVKLAKEHAEKISPLIANDRRFGFIRVSEWWGEEGKLAVSGYIDNQADFDALQTLVRGTRPPVPVAWQVEVVGASTTNLHQR